MNKIIIFLNSLSKREKIVLIIGLYLTTVIIGIFFSLNTILKKREILDKKIDKEFQKYYELVKLTDKYLSIKKSVQPTEKLDIDFISKLMNKTNFRANSIKKLSNNQIELIFENISGDIFITFLKVIKDNNLSVKTVELEIEKDIIKRGKVILTIENLL